MKPALLATLVVAIFLTLAGAGVLTYMFAFDKGSDTMHTPLTPPPQLQLPKAPTGNTPVPCPVDENTFCSLHGLTPGKECSYSSTYVNDQCQMDCDDVMKMWSQAGTQGYPFQSATTLGNASETMGITGKPGSSATTDQQACNLARAMQQYALQADHNRGTDFQGLYNFYTSIGTCISHAYHC